MLNNYRSQKLGIADVTAVITALSWGPPNKSWVAICHFHYVMYMKSTNDKNWPYDGPDS